MNVAWSPPQSFQIPISGALIVIERLVDRISCLLIQGFVLPLSPFGFHMFRLEEPVRCVCVWERVRERERRWIWRAAVGGITPSAIDHHRRRPSSAPSTISGTWIGTKTMLALRPPIKIIWWRNGQLWAGSPENVNGNGWNGDHSYGISLSYTVCVCIRKAFHQTMWTCKCTPINYAVSINNHNQVIRYWRSGWLEVYAFFHCFLIRFFQHSQKQIYNIIVCIS